MLDIELHYLSIYFMFSNSVKQKLYSMT